jgi:hypothetical protein
VRLGQGKEEREDDDGWGFGASLTSCIEHAADSTGHTGGGAA